MILNELLFDAPQGSDFKIVIQDFGSDLEILMGEVDQSKRLCDPFAPELEGKPWSLGLFLNIAHKIISDHGGKLFLNPEGPSAFPMVIRIPRMIKA